MTISDDKAALRAELDQRAKKHVRWVYTVRLLYFALAAVVAVLAVLAYQYGRLGPSTVVEVKTSEALACLKGRDPEASGPDRGCYYRIDYPKEKVTEFYDFDTNTIIAQGDGVPKHLGGAWDPEASYNYAFPYGTIKRSARVMFSSDWNAKQKHIYSCVCKAHSFFPSKCPKG